jgi:hypothetical protein
LCAKPTSNTAQLSQADGWILKPAVDAGVPKSEIKADESTPDAKGGNTVRGNATVRQACRRTACGVRA